MKKTENMKT